MPLPRLLIDWPLTPYTGWGSYGIQLVQALLAARVAWPVLTYKADRSPHCDPHWLLRLDGLENFSASIIERLKAQPNEVLSTNCQLALGPLGNLVPALRCLAEHQVGVTFYERTTIDEKYLEALAPYKLVITGSKWNQRILTESGFSRAVLVHQGVDSSRFHPIPVPRLLDRPFVIFAGGKLEARKGQDIVLAAFRQFLKLCPEALLITSWGNLGNVALDTVQLSPHVEGAPTNGDSISLFNWLQQNGIPVGNILLAPIMANAQLANLIKQADVAVFTSRCEGGTNLMAMESLACGVPTVLSANTGHLDLLEMGMEHALPVGASGVGHVPAEITADYGGDKGKLWGETQPEELVEKWLKIKAEKDQWRQRGQRGAQAMAAMGWDRSMKELIGVLQERQLLG